MNPQEISLDDSRQRHYLKKLLLSKLIEEELGALNDASALRHFGHPFKQTETAMPCDALNTQLPILRFVFDKFVRTFPFLSKTDQDSLWRDKVQVFIEIFVSKRISSSEDRAESSKREKLGLRIKSMLVLLMNAGIRAGKEASITIDDAQRQTDQTVTHIELNSSDGKYINGFDVNVAGVRTMQKSRSIRKREHHSEFLVRTRRMGAEDVVVARRYGAFKKLQDQLKEEFPGKQITRLPMKNKAPATMSSYIPSMPSFTGGARDSIDEDSGASAEEEEDKGTADNGSTTTKSFKIPREKQRLTLRSFLRRVLQDTQLAKSTALRHFLLAQPIVLSAEDKLDCQNRRDLDALRAEEQLKFLEVARERARDLDTHMDLFKKQLIQDNGLTKIFTAIRECDTIEELPVQYIKVIEWARIEIAATLYQLFIADDNSSELFSQAKRIHALFPYAVLKNIIRFSNPMTMMRAGIDLFLATPFGRASLFQRMFSSTLTEDIAELEASITALRAKVNDKDVCDKIKNFVHAREDQQAVIRVEAQDDDVDLIVALMRSGSAGIQPRLSGHQITKIFMANIAWTSAVEGALDYKTEEAQLYGYFSQLLKLYTRQRDKQQMVELLFDGITSVLLKDIVAIFYEPLARVYKAASIHNSIMDFSRFAEDCIQTVKDADEQDLSTNPTALVQTFIDLTARHQNSFFHFVHEAHSHDDGLFDGLMAWVELILSFLREGAAEQLDLDTIFSTTPNLDKPLALKEIDACIEWNGKMKVWRQEKMRKKVAAAHQNGSLDGSDGATGNNSTIPTGTLSGADFGLNQDDLEEVMYEDSDGDEELEEAIDDLDPLEAELRRKKRAAQKLQSRYGEPKEPVVVEVLKMSGNFKDALRRILAATS